MKKICFILLSLILIISCSEKEEKQTEIKSKEIQMFSVPAADIINKQYSFNQHSNIFTCEKENPIICAINHVVQCTINPKLNICSKENLPKFVLMEDESLQRPTEMSYKITQIKPLMGGLLHIYTQGRCNNNWFGLCQGQIIYVMEQKNQNWIVSDIFALGN